MQDVVVGGVLGKDNVIRVGKVNAFPKEVENQQVVQVLVGLVAGMLTEWV